MTRELEVQQFPDTCQFLTCLIEGAHHHPICPDCKTVRFGNLACPTCRAEPHGIEVHHGKTEPPQAKVLFGIMAMRTISDLLVCPHHRSPFNRHGKIFFLFAETCAQAMTAIEDMRDAVSIMTKFEEMPACERVPREKLLEFYELAGVTETGTCDVCEREEVRGFPRWRCPVHEEELDFVCLDCFARPLEADA